MQLLSASGERELMLYLIWFHWTRCCDGACDGRFSIACREKGLGLGVRGQVGVRV